MISTSSTSPAAFTTVAASPSSRAASVPTAPATIPCPANTCCIPLKIYTRPCPPASTTPAFFRIGSCSGVCFSASSVASTTRSHSSAGVMASVSAARLFSAATLATVRIVPSVGFITAL